MDITRPVPHSQAIRSLVQSLAGDAEMTGLELIRWLHMVTNAYAGAADEQLRDSAFGLALGPAVSPAGRRTLRLRRRRLADASQPAPERQQEHHQRAAARAGGAGLDRAQRVPDDRRAFQIRLTDAGRTLVETSAPAHIAFLNEMTAGLTAEEGAQLIDLLEKLYRSLSSADRRQADKRTPDA